MTKPLIIFRNGMQFELQLPPGSQFKLLEAGIVVASPEQPPMLYRYRDDGPLLAEVIVPLAGKTHGAFRFT